MARIAAALALKSDADSCRELCVEVISGARHWGPAEQRVLSGQLPELFHRLYSWLGVADPAIQECLVRTFHPSGPLVVHFATWGGAPAFVFPMHCLPPRVLRAAVLSAAGAGARGGGFGPHAALALRPKGSDDFESAWFGLLGVKRLARSPTGDLEGVKLTAHEYMLTCLFQYLVYVQPAAAPAYPGSAGFGAGGAAGGSVPGPTPGFGGVGSGASGGAAGSGSTGASPGQGPAPAGRGAPPPGSLSPAFERLLLAHLQAYLQHNEYELSYAHEPHVAHFLLHLLHEFLIAPRPPAEAPPVSSRYGAAIAHDARIRPGSLQAVRLITLHLLANPALRRGCEEPLGFGAPATAGRTARLTREMSRLGPSIVAFIAEILACLHTQKHLGVEVSVSLMRLWLVLLQPWKAKRLLRGYLALRPPEPVLDGPPAAAGGAGKGAQPVDVALLGLELETAPGKPEAPLATLPKELQPGNGSSSSTAGGAHAVCLVPGEGDAQSWKSYVMKFHQAYNLFEKFLTVPLHRELCLKLCRHCAALDTSGSQLLQQRHVVVTLRVLAQALLCFTDQQLLRALAEAPGDGSEHLAGATPLFLNDADIHPHIRLAVALLWAALLAAANNQELRPLLTAVSRQLKHLPCPVPTLEDSAQHQAFARQVLRDVGQDAPEPAAAAAAPLGAVPPLPEPMFIGSEWERPIRGGEVELLMHITYWLACMIDWALGREPKRVVHHYVPQTEWPRMFANVKLTIATLVMLFFAVFW